MERLERISSKSTNATLIAIKQALGQFQSKIWTALPAMVKSYNPSGGGGGTVEAQPTIQAQLRQPNGIWVDTTMPLCVDCPVMFPGAGSFTLTFPITAGDEGLLVFSSRCIDSWWQSGGIQKQAELRMHDLSDGFFFPALLSQANKVPDVSANTCQLRSKDGSVSIELDSMTGQINVVAPGGLWVNGVMVTIP